MAQILATLIVFLLAVLMMAIGVMVHGRHLKGSCGGVGGTGNCACSAREARSCETRRNQSAS